MIIIRFILLGILLIPSLSSAQTLSLSDIVTLKQMIRNGATSAVTGWPTVSTTKEITWANALANAVRIGDGVTPVCVYTDSVLGPMVRPCTDANVHTIIPTNFTWCLFDIEGNSCMLTVDPDAANANAIYQFTAGYKPTMTLLVPLSPRGTATMTETNIVTNQPKGYWGQNSDVDTDAFDFHFPVTKKMVGITTFTITLWGVSTNAAPAGNIKYTCAAKSFRPGIDTYAAHDTTGEQGITLTPATQYRPVSATSSAIPINGTVAEGAEIIGSCESDATGTTSAQMTSFWLRGDAQIQFLSNSLSD